MSVKLNLEISIKCYKKLADYLESHEDDIACSVNDYDDLTELFEVVFDAAPKEHVL